MEVTAADMQILEAKRLRAMQALEINKSRDKFRTALMIVINVVIAFILSIAIATLIVRFTPASATAALVFGFGLGLIAWTQVLSKTIVFDYCFVNVKANWVLILANQMEYDSIPSDPDERIKMFERGSLREVGQGIRGKWPWEVPVHSVNLQTEVLIGPSKEKESLQCVTKDNVQLAIKWQVVMTPLVGFAINLVRRNQDALEAYFKGLFDQQIITWVKTHDEEDVFRLMKDLKSVFMNTLGGSKSVSIEEMDWGTFTNDPQIISVMRDERYQKALEAGKIGESMAREIERINTVFANSHGDQPDADMVLATAASLVGNEVSGLLLIPGGSKSLADVAAKSGLKLPEKSTKKGGK